VKRSARRGDTLAAAVEARACVPAAFGRKIAPVYRADQQQRDIGEKIEPRCALPLANY